ncbi:hypothetical protein [Oceanobacillus neutriphilus]|uniref:Uncharacterized protein n=1 Tax=Oceanobacillus neutriphilus TaxID=531815 RepID=A0ABQ2NZ93_9BACI|nr:hypothetical protein [Oceanobacillus neutriphilus]GGP14266.1 hypothetical protein GCM10011346_37540 [Oceanobacillus neutriphilus]
MEKNSIWLPLVASVGIGAATFYSMTSQQQNVGQALQQAAPFFSSKQKSNSAKKDPETLGPFGMS